MRDQPYDRSGPPFTRREFLLKSAIAAGSLSAAGSLLEACARPGVASNHVASVGQGGIHYRGSPFPLARQDAPVTWNVFADNPPIKSGLPTEKNATLQIYDWADVIYPKVNKEFEDRYHCKVSYTTFNNMDEAMAKMLTGQVNFDFFNPTVDVLGKLITGKLIQPLNHSYIPAISDNWPEFGNPFYDRGWRYTAPNTVFQTGIGYRRDVISDQEIASMSNPYEIFWNPKYKGKVGIYDDYREAMGMVLLKNGVMDVNTDDKAAIDRVTQDLIALTKTVGIRPTINGAYVGLPKGTFVLHQAWSGDMVLAQYYLPSGVSKDVLGYWYPSQGGGMIGSDILVIPKNAPHPVLAHAYINFRISTKYSLQNFVWEGYQTPLNSINPSKLIHDGTVPPTLREAVVYPRQFDTGHFLLELPPSVDAQWHQGWQQFLATS